MTCNIIDTLEISQTPDLAELCKRSVDNCECTSADLDQNWFRHHPKVVLACNKTNPLVIGPFQKLKYFPFRTVKLVKYVLISPTGAVEFQSDDT